MQHAGAAALDLLANLLASIRAARPDLRERSRGVFYARSSAYLHFHEDPAGFFADLKGADGWRRTDVTEEPGRARLLRDVAAAAPRTRRATPSGRRRSAAGAPRRSASGRPGPR